MTRTAIIPANISGRGGHKDAAFARLSGQRAPPVPAEVCCPTVVALRAQMSQSNQQRGAPLTLVGSPPRIHLLQRKFNTMDPPVKLAGRRTGKAARRAEPEQKRAAVTAAAGSLRTRGRFFLFPGIPQQNNDKRLRLQTAVIPKWS